MGPSPCHDCTPSYRRDFPSHDPTSLGILQKNISTQWIGLVVLAISLFAIPVATTSGENTEHAFYRGTISAQLDDAGATALEVHAETADAVAVF